MDGYIFMQLHVFVCVFPFNLLNPVSVFSSYRNQSIDLHSKSIDWFLYEDNSGNKWVKLKE